jgi:hypothetical protein
MKSKIGLATIAIGMGLSFVGCATTNSINDTLDAVAKKIHSGTEILRGDRTLGTETKNTDNIKPWEIKKSADNHFVLDPLFALPGATTREEAEKRVSKLLDEIRRGYVNYGEFQTKKSRGCRIWKTTVKGNGINTIFVEADQGSNCSSNMIKRTDEYVCLSSYMQFQVVNIGNKWYMIVKDTNAKSTNIFGFLGHAFNQSSKNHALGRCIPGLTNRIISKLVVSLSNEAIKNNGWNDKFIDIHIDSKDNRAKEYRDWYAQQMKKAML